MTNNWTNLLPRSVLRSRNKRNPRGIQDPGEDTDINMKGLAEGNGEH